MKKLIVLLIAIICLVGYGQAQCQGSLNGNITLRTNGAPLSFCGAATSTVLTGITVTPAGTTVLQGTTLTYTATGIYSDSSSADITSQVSWSSSNSGIASIGSAANPQPVSCLPNVSGAVVISATLNGITGTGNLNCNPPPSITPLSLPNGSVNQSYSQIITAGGGVPSYTWTQTGTLPTGLVFTSGSPSATITGSPTAAGTFNFTLQACDSQSHCTSNSYTVVIDNAPSRIPTLPQAWADETESIQNSYTQTLTIPILSGSFNGTAMTWNCHGSAKGPYVYGLSGFQAFVNEVEICRANYGDSFHLLFAPGSVFTIVNNVENTAGYHGFYLSQSTSPADTSTSPIVFDSTKPVPLGTNLDSNGVVTQARIGTYAISQVNGIVCSTTFCTVTTAVAMPVAPSWGDLVTIWLPDNSTFAGQYTICNHTRSGCSDPTTTTFMYPWTGAAGTTQNGVVWSLQARTPITSMSSSGCSAALAQCTVTVNFASLPSPTPQVNDRIQITGASPSMFNGTWYVASVGASSITFFSYTEYIGNISATTPGLYLNKNHILADQVACCMYTIELSGGTGPLIMGDPKFHNYAFFNGEFRVQSSTTAETFDFLSLSSYLTGESAQTPPQMNASGCNGGVAQLNCDEPVHVGFDRDYIHGYDFPLVSNTAAQIRGAVRAECGWCYLTNSYIEGINDSNSDDNIISTRFGTGPVKVVNNYMEGATESIMSGYYGGCIKVQNFQQVADYEIRRNWITDNPFLIQNAAVLIPGLTTKYVNYIRKNKAELKAGQRILYDGNILEQSAGAAGQQNGVMFATNDEGSFCGITSIVADLTYTNNILRHGLAGAYNKGRGNYDATATADRLSVTDNSLRFSYTNNLGYDLGDPTRFGRPGWGGSSWSGFGLSYLVEFSTGGWSFPPSSKLTLSSVANASGGSTVYTGTISNGASNTYAGQPVVISGFTNSANNGTFTASASTATTLTLANASGVAETHAATALMQGCTGTTSVSGGLTTATITCPNYGPVTQQGVGIHAGDWIEVVNCLDPNYNVKAPRQVPSLTDSYFSFSVSYIVPTAAGASTSGCQLNNWYGIPRWLTYSHNTMLFDGSITNSFYNNVQMSGGIEYLWTGQAAHYSMKRNATIQNNIMSYKQTTFGIGPNILQCAGTGTSNSNAEVLCWDTNTFVWTNNVMSGGATASNYTEWNSPNGIAGANNGVSPPVTNKFLTNGTPGDACTSIASPNSSCFGFVGNYATTNQAPDFAPAPLDYHQFGLVSNSNWAFGQAAPASDGSSDGVNLTFLDYALNYGVYPCLTNCGTGPNGITNPPTLASRTTPNTSACYTDSAPPYCTSALQNFQTNVANVNAQTVNLVPLGFVSQMPIQSYLYPGAQTRVIMAYQPWFPGQAPCWTLPTVTSAHPCTGQNENSAAVVSQQHSLMLSEGVTDVSPDWYGNSGTQTFINNTVLTQATDLASRCTGTTSNTCPLHLMIMVDGGLITSGMSGVSGCPQGSTDQTSCISTVLNAAYDYIDANWGRQIYYSTDPVSGQPMTLTFITKGNWSGTNWATVWTNVKAHMAGYATPYKVIEEFGSFTDTAIDGAYGWPQSEAYGSTTQFCWKGGSCSFDYFNDLYTSAQANPTKILVGHLFPGFDGSNNTYNNNVTARQCGQLLYLESQKIWVTGTGFTLYSAANPLNWLLIPTWNDYGEGTNVENGVDNCYTISSSLSSNTLNWSLSASDTTYASTNTIDHYTIWYTNVLGNLVKAADVPVGNLSTNLLPIIPPGLTTTLYVEMVGKPLIINRMSNGVSYTHP